MGNSSSNADQKVVRKHILRSKEDKPGRSAVILGPTGATGKFITSYLIRSPEWSKVTIIHRRVVDLDELGKKANVTFDEEQKSKVSQHKVDMEKLCENEDEMISLFKAHEIVICVLGTTRAIAKSAEQFKKVDFEMVRDAAILSKKAEVPHFSLLSSKGANANVWANDWKVTHGLLYMKTKGEAEESVIAQKFCRTSIFRPGVLGRDNESGGVMSKLPVRDLAAVMIYDAESDDVIMDKQEEEKKDESNVEPVLIYESADINQLLVDARNNYNAVCEDKQEVVEDKVDDNDQDKVEQVDNKEDNVDDKDKEQEVIKDKVEEVDKIEDVQKEEIQKEEVQEAATKYEVVDKPDTEDKPDEADAVQEAQKVEEVEEVEEAAKGDENVQDDYVEVENDAT